MGGDCSRAADNSKPKTWKSGMLSGNWAISLLEICQIILDAFTLLSIK